MMLRRSLQVLAIGAVTATAAVSQAAAGSCCAPCWSSCVTSQYIPVVVVPSVVPVPIYVVNQGPIYTGPGIVTYPGYFDTPVYRAPYPYVGADYYYPQYQTWRRPVKRAYRTAYRHRQPLYPYGK
jgi:hypothetical protein